MNVYSNLSHRRKTKRDHASRRRAEYLASLPKHPVKRILYRLHPKRVAGYWFSKRGLFMAMKIAGVGVLLIVLLTGAVFAYYRKDLDQIRPSELAKRVQSTVTKYYDRNDKLLWSDTGTGNYTLVVKGDEISKYMKQATVAIEDKDFYKHGGVSVPGMARAAVSNLQGDSTQGGSTLTQQLIKQVYFPPEEQQQRGLAGIPRKIKEIILSVEVERMYNKDQILNLYLNESPYGGRRNGVESAAQTYFGVSAKKLNLAQSAMLAAIPNQTSLYNPYNTAGNDALIARQHKTLDNMARQGYITQDEADKAKKVKILDSLKAETSQYQNIKAPHFVQMVRSELERKLGKATVGKGGLTVKTTLDYRVQKKLEKEMSNMFTGKDGVNCYGQICPNYAGFSNGAGTIEDVKTGQIIGMMGSKNFNAPGFGQDNEAMAFIQPGSSVKPLVYAQLFTDQGSGDNYGSGSILSDVKTDFGGGYTPQDADGKFMGNINIRHSLDLSRNIPAIKAMAVSGEKKTLSTIREMGNKYYCTRGQEQDAGLSAAIGSCGTRMIDHVNALASLGRGGDYIPQSSILNVTNSSGDTIEKYEKPESKEVVNSQAAYIVSDILGDNDVRKELFGNSITPDLDAAGIKVALKTGTSDINLKPKDIWTVAYTPSLSMAVWLGNPDTRALTNGNSSIPAKILDPVMTYATELYQKDNKAKKGDWFKAPKGIQHINGEVFPSYYDKSKHNDKDTKTFDKVSKKLATSCTPDGAKTKVGVTEVKDPLTKKTTYIAQDGYNASEKDDKHECNDVKPSVTSIKVDGNRITVRVRKGTFSLDSLDINVNGKSVGSVNVSGSGDYSTSYEFSKKSKVTATIKDTGYYEDSASSDYSPKDSGDDSGPTENDD